MSLWDSLFGSDNQSTGNEVLRSFFYEAQKFPEFTYPTYEAWIIFLESKVPDFVSVIGELINNNYRSTTVAQASERLIQLANQSKGLASVSAITGAAGGSGDSVNWLAAIPEVSAESAEDFVGQVVDTAQGIGQGVGGTLALAKYLPWILGGAAALYIVFLAKSTGSQVGSGLRKLSEAGADRIRGRK